MRPFLLFVFCVSGYALQAGQPVRDTTFYDCLMSGKMAGQEWMVSRGEQGYFFHSEYNDRGRGPSVNSHLIVDEKGNVTQADFEGVDYFKTKVDEHFVVRG